MSGVFDQNYVKRLNGTSVKQGATKMDLAEQLMADIAEFKRANQCDRMVMIWCASTETFIEPQREHADLDSLERAMRENNEAVAPSMIYAYAALKSGVPFANGAPNLTVDVPALTHLAQEARLPVCGKDFKTGQTLMKTIIAPGLKARMLGLHGWFSTNILGNRDGEVLDDPGRSRPRRNRSFRSWNTSSSRMSTPPCTSDFYHIVRINYYPPRGDNKEGWDNIDIFGWLGYPMQIKVNFLCRDSILAAPIVLDLVLFMDLAQAVGHARDPGVAVVLFQEPNDRPGPLPGARPGDPANEAEEHASPPPRRRLDHPPGA